MSKHHNYTNYNKFNAAAVEPVVREAVEVPVEPEEVQMEEMTDTISIDETTLFEVVEPVKSEPKTGIVTANKLNIRKLPVIGAEVVTVVEEGTNLMVDPDYETVEWIKVYTEAGVEGYCMKKFVTVK